MYKGNTFKFPCTGGWVTNPNEDNITPDAMTAVNNINVHNGGRQPRGGCEALNSAITDTPRIMGLYQFLPEDGDPIDFLVDESGDSIGDENGNVIYFDSTTLLTVTSDGKIQSNYSTVLKTGLTTNVKPYFETYYNEVYISNGVDKPQVWSQAKTYTWDMGSPDKCTAALAGAGAGNVDNGAHYYGITFVTASGESTVGVASNTVTVADKTANGKVSLTAIPTGPSGTTSRKIYRTKAAGSTYYLLDTLADNTTTTYTDNTADSGITVAAPTTSLAFLPSSWQGNWPKFFVKHGRGVNSRLWAFGCPDTPNYIYASANGLADFSDANVVAIRIMSSMINSGFEFLGNLIVNSRDKNFYIDDTALTVANWGYQGAAWKGGVAHQNLAVETPTDVAIMTEAGDIYSITAAQQYGDIKMASLVRPFFLHRWIKENLDMLKIDRFHGIFDPDLRCLRFFVCENGAEYPRTCLLYFIDIGLWTRHTYAFDIVSSAVVRVSQSNWKIYVGGGVGIAYGLEWTTLLDGASTYSSSFTLPNNPQDNPRSKKQYDWVHLVMEPKGTEVMSVTSTVDGNALTAETITMTGAQSFLRDFSAPVRTQGQRYKATVSNSDGKNYFISQVLLDVQDLGSM